MCAGTFLLIKQKIKATVKVKVGVIKMKKNNNQIIFYTIHLIGGRRSPAFSCENLWIIKFK